MAFKLEDRQKVAVAIAISFMFFASELAVAFKTKSLALMADAFHYLNDLIGFIVTLTTIIISDKTQFPPDLSFGWQRARLLGAFFNGAFLLALGVSIFLQSIERFISVHHVSHVKLVLIMGCIGLGLNMITVAFLHEHRPHQPDPERETASESDGSASITLQDGNMHSQHRHVKLAVKAPGRDLGMLGALLHVAGDALNNIGVIVAAVVIWFSESPARFYADPAVGMAIAVMILFSALPLVRRSGEILLQSAPQGVSLGDIKHDIEKIPGVESVHELHVWRLDQRKAIASAHILVSDPDVAAFMDKARTIRECLHAYGIHSTTIQPELAAPTPTPAPPPAPAQAPASGQTAAAAAAAAAACQISCGRAGVCDHLMCCNTVVKI